MERKKLRNIREDKKRVSLLAMFGIFLAFILLVF